MRVGTTFYLSRVIGNTVFSSENVPIAKLKDIVVDLNSVRPLAKAVKVKYGNRIVTVDITHFSIAKAGEQYRITCDALHEMEYDEESFCLVRDILDKQIVDMFGRKVVRVNDLRLAALSTGTYVVAFDVGFEGFLRRLGVAKPLKELLKPLHVTIPSNLLLWDEVETIEPSSRGIRLANTYSKLSTMHPSDLADVLEDLDRSTRLEIFSSLDAETAADVLEELEPDAQATVVESLTTPQAVEVLGRLPADEVADILEEVRDDKAEEILRAMDTDSRSEIQDLMEYDDDSVGSIMSTEQLTFHKDLTVECALLSIRSQQPEGEFAHYLFVTDDRSHLLGIVSLRDIVMASPSTTIDEIMDEDIVSVQDEDNIGSLAATMSKYNLSVMPVVNPDNELLGAVLLSDLLDHFMKSRRRR